MLKREILAIMLAAGIAMPTLAQTGTDFVGSCETFYNASRSNCECILSQINPSLSTSEIDFLGQNMAANSGGATFRSGALLISDDRIPQINEILQTAAGSCLPGDTLLREGFNNG